ncbi:Translation initiation factor 2B subunit, eIF-2B alpha/beta/delta family [Halopelagius inordinatus]|uniref:Translation initiation factor 2B subunit, eIF-2B alpha/beta/delta family n=1 Tax=Halopelagius inordinatus TaxID=553467 RepID=A0A1I2TEX7_9EURY|nr:NUDIX domain-containing protein [Halopelagius inordinatus]SFG60871.1 Translation initiation factor 2B subunit, eIF-2B alpha/beta/delta family [Halopelagius inordinatus]
MAHVVTCFVRNRGAILLTRRSDSVGTFADQWAGVSGYVEGDPSDADDDARRELREEVGLSESDLRLVRVGAPLDVSHDEGEFTVHPFLFETETRATSPDEVRRADERGPSTTTNEELAAVTWADPTEMRERETVPRLWDAWRHVAPTVADVREDETHGSAWIAARALEVLRDDAADADDWDSVARTARKLRDARPSMAAVSNRVNRAMATADRTPESVRERCIDLLRASFDAADGVTTAATNRLADSDATAVATISRSGTVRRVLRESDPDAVVVAESRPEREGVGVAEWAATETDARVTLTTEAALPAAFSRLDVDAAVVGADAVLPDGGVVNKTGTTGLALAAREAGVPVYAVATCDKVRPTGEDGVGDESSGWADVYDGEASLSVFAPTFEATAPTLLDGVVTEAGFADEADVRDIAEEHAENAAWDDAGG